jgi:hypothetical protein
MTRERRGQGTREQGEEREEQHRRRDVKRRERDEEKKPRISGRAVTQRRRDGWTAARRGRGERINRVEEVCGATVIHQWRAKTRALALARAVQDSRARARLKERQATAG